jgi:uncharacterized membrane protein YagU involved in acid resistance
LFSKTALVVAIGANGGLSSAIKDMKFSLTYWGISRIFSFGYAVFAAKWEDVTAKNRIKIDRKIKIISNKIKVKITKNKPSLKMKILFNIFRMVQKKYEFILHDFEYWKRQGWLDKNRPWKNNV